MARSRKGGRNRKSRQMNENEPQPIECRAAVEISPTATNEILFLPIGLHAITPVHGGIGRPIKVKVDQHAAAAIEKQRTQLMSSGKRPYFDFNHEDGPASFWPESFLWRSGEGVIASGEWSRRGKTAVEGKDFRAFSPVFHVDNKRAEAALVICKKTPTRIWVASSIIQLSKICPCGQKTPNHSARRRQRRQRRRKTT